jgi:S1-C subfamily serine protease
MEVAVKLRRRQYTLIVTTILTVALVLTACSMLAVSLKVGADSTLSGEAMTSAKTAGVPEMQLETPEPSRTKPAWLGIIGTTVQPELAQAMRLPADQSGVLVQFVESLSPAKAAGIQACEEFVSLGDHRWLVGGDIITALDGQPVSNMRELHTLLSQATAGQQVSLTLLRDGEKLTLTTTLAEYPELDLNSSSLHLRIT